MRIKKCFAIFSLMMIMCLSVLPSFASAEEQSKINVLEKFDVALRDDDKKTKISIPGGSDKAFKLDKVYKGISGFYISFENPFTNPLSFKFLLNGVKNYEIALSDRMFNSKEGNFTINYSGSFDEIRISSSGTGSTTDIYELKVFAMPPFVAEEISNLNAIPEVDKVKFTWENPKSPHFTGVKVYFEGEERFSLKPNEIEVVSKNLEPDKFYNYKFVAMYGDQSSNGVEKRIRTLVDMKKVPPSPVSSLTAEPTDKTVKLKWKSPKDDDLAGFKILQNGKQVAEIGLEEEFTVKNLQSLTDYTFGVISVDRDKNDSPPVSLSVKTLEENDEEPPHVPSNVFAKPSNGALIASWDKVSDKDLAGYNLYVDGKKINSNLITSTNFVIKNLENSKKYKIQVQAVDRSGNASELSLAAFGTPDVNTIPVIESNYGVKDVSDGVGTMFSQIWPALAFSVGIVLAFYVIYKLKHTILP
ncbi:TPA: fibronectin type III domain-containing protein [Bacillus mobilis]